jgi:hypothetical protein
MQLRGLEDGCNLDNYHLVATQVRKLIPRISGELPNLSRCIGDGKHGR